MQGAPAMPRAGWVGPGWDQQSHANGFSGIPRGLEQHQHPPVMHSNSSPPVAGWSQAQAWTEQHQSQAQQYEPSSPISDFSVANCGRTTARQPQADVARGGGRFNPPTTSSGTYYEH